VPPILPAPMRAILLRAMNASGSCYGKNYNIRQGSAGSRDF